MTGSELIARQALQLEELRDEVAELKSGIAKARMQIYGCGGPLNDNVLGYTREQMMPFQRIADAIGHD